MTNKPKCPKCGAEYWKTSTIGEPCIIYDCSSWWEISSGDAWQSDRCRIAQLEAEVKQWKDAAGHENYCEQRSASLAETVAQLEAENTKLQAKLAAVFNKVGCGIKSKIGDGYVAAFASMLKRIIESEAKQ